MINHPCLGGFYRLQHIFFSQRFTSKTASSRQPSLPSSPSLLPSRLLPLSSSSFHPGLSTPQGLAVSQSLYLSLSPPPFLSAGPAM
jgi:hypothetical protein